MEVLTDEAFTKAPVGVGEGESEKCFHKIWLETNGSGGWKLERECFLL